MKQILTLKRPFLLLLIALIFTGINTIAAQQTQQGESTDSKPVPTGGVPVDNVISAPPQPQQRYAPYAVDVFPTITVWYEDDLEFGQNGNPQQWVNIMGNVSGLSPSNITLRYKLNGVGGFTLLDKGADKRRLYQEGDFNIELDIDDLINGTNTVEIRARNNNTNQETREFYSFTYDANGTVSDSFTVDWSQASTLHEVAQPVDGEWTIEPGGTLRPLDVATGITPTLAYDRLVAFGDMSMTDYQVTVPFTIHSIDTDKGFDFPSNGPGVGMIMRWQGHYQQLSDNQLRTGWRRFGSLAWFRWSGTENSYTSGMEMLGWSDGAGGEGNIIDTSTQTPVFNQEYTMKMMGQTRPDGDYYRFKVWLSSQPEPEEWTMEGLVDEPAAWDNGSFLLVAHHVDVSFGDVTVIPLDEIRQTVNVTTGANGSVVKDPNQADYGFGEEVNLTAVPNNGYKFAGWSGDITSSDNPLTLTMEEDYNITANFEEAGAPFSDDFNSCDTNGIWTFVNPANDNNATVAALGDKLELFVPNGSSHDLFPPSEDALRFMQEAENEDFQVEVKFDSVMNASDSNTIQGILVEQNADNYIRFDFYTDGSDINVYHAAVQGGALVGGATVNGDDISGNMPYLRVTRTGNVWTQEYSDTGEPGDWVEFDTFTHALTVNNVGVFGGNSGSNPAHTVLVDYFYNTAALGVGDVVPTTLQTLTSPNNGGTVEVLTSNYSCGDTVMVEATANEGFQFVGWDGDLSGTTNPASLTFAVGMEVTALFKEEFELTTQTTGQGSVTVSPNKPVYLDGESVQLTAVPAQGYEFSSWSGLTDSNETITITITEDTIITANFVVEGTEPDTFELYLPLVTR